MNKTMMHEGPSVLLCGRPLTFGDVEQIRVLKEMRRIEEEAEERERKRAAGEKIPFDVCLRVRVAAIDEEEAERIVMRGTISASHKIEVDHVEEPQ